MRSAGDGDDGGADQIRPQSLNVDQRAVKRIVKGLESGGKLVRLREHRSGAGVVIVQVVDGIRRNAGDLGELKPLDKAPEAAAGKDQQEKKEETPVQRKASGHEPAYASSAALDEGMRSSTRPLDAETRSFMELRFGHDFSKVKIHTGEAASRSARSLGALAYTFGDSIVFDAGRYSPRSADGRRLLAHELTHVVQQTGGPARRTASPVFRNSGLRIARQAAPPAPPANLRIVRLDNNVIAEIGRGNANVANTLRQLAKDSSVRVEMSRGVYNETTRVSGDMLAARKALIQNLNIKIVDEPMAERVPTYEKYATSPDFPTHGQGKITGGESATLEDLPHITSAAAGGEDVELWTFDGRVKANAEKFGVKVAPESNIPINKNVPDSYTNILKLVPEVIRAFAAARLGLPGCASRATVRIRVLERGPAPRFRSNTTPRPLPLHAASRTQDFSFSKPRVSTSRCPMYLSESCWM